MDNITKNGFTELTSEDMTAVDGGASAFTVGRGIAGGVLAVVAVIAAPVTGVLLFTAVGTGLLAVGLSGAKY